MGIIKAGADLVYFQQFPVLYIVLAKHRDVLQGFLIVFTGQF